MFKIHFSDPAEKDLLAIIQYISEALKSPSAARQLLLEIEQQIKVLEDMPYSHSLVLDEYLASRSIRSLLVKNYQIFYIVKENEKIISTIFLL